jgi:hypothetical protein
VHVVAEALLDEGVAELRTLLVRGRVGVEMGDDLLDVARVSVDAGVLEKRAEVR